jgi:hypothetical protein
LPRRDIAPRIVRSPVEQPLLAGARIFCPCAHAYEEKMFRRGLMGVLARWDDDLAGTAGEK